MSAIHQRQIRTLAIALTAIALAIFTAVLIKIHSAI